MAFEILIWWTEGNSAFLEPSIPNGGDGGEEEKWTVLFLRQYKSFVFTYLEPSIPNGGDGGEEEEKWNV